MSKVPPATYLAVPVPEAEAFLRDAIGRFQPERTLPGPEHTQAHITVLGPFVPRAELDDRLIRRLNELFAAFEPFSFSLVRAANFHDVVVYLAPEPEQPFRALTNAVHREFPGYAPYGGKYDSVVPHMTVGPIRSPQQEQELIAAGEAAVPLHAVAREVALIEGSESVYETIAVFRIGQRVPA